MLMAKIQGLIEPAVTALGYEFVGCELSKQGRSYVLRVYLDAEQGITVDDCAKVSRQISTIFDVEEPFTNNYYLEVSSPGLDRPLFTLAHYQRYVGQRIRFRTRVPRETGRRRFIGELIAVIDNNITIKLDEDGQPVVFAFDEIEKANIVADS